MKKKNNLRWFNHVYGRPEHAIVKRSDGVQTNTKRKREWSKKTWLEIKNYVKTCNLTEEIALHNAEWRDKDSWNDHLSGT